MEQEEFLEIVNQKGEIIGHAKRSEIHGNPLLIHRVVHLLVFNKVGEDLIFSSKREMQEELGIVGYEPEFVYS